MSSSYSSNTIDDGVGISVNVLNESTQNCQTQVYESQDLVIEGNTGTTINIGDINWSEVITMDLNCTQTSTTQTSIDNSLQQTISQVAKSVAQAFGLPGNSAKAQNNTKLWTQMGIAIKNVYNQTCKSRLDTSQGISIKNNANSTVTIASLNFSEQINSMVNCVQNDSSVSDVKNKIIQNLEQEATAVVQGFLGPLIIIVIIIIAVIAIVFFQTLQSPYFLGFIIVLIILYLVLAFYLKWWPFSVKKK